MKVLLLGGTGAMGTHLSGILAAQGCATFITSRRPHPASGNKIYLTGNAHDPAFLDRILSEESWDAIVDFMVYPTKEFQEKAEQLLNATGHYLFLSSARVYANSDAPITENSPRWLNVSKDKEFLKTDVYPLAKARQEDILAASPRRNWTIIRPYITYSEIRLQLGTLEKEAWLYRLMKNRTCVFFEQIARRRTTLTHGRDVAAAIAALIGKDAAKGEAFHITCGESTSWRDVMNIYLDEFARATHTQPKAKIVDRPMLLTEQVRNDRLHDRIFDNAKIGAFIDVDGFLSPDAGLRAALDGFLANPTFKTPDAFYQGYCDLIAHERTNPNELGGLRNKVKYLLMRRFRRIAVPLLEGWLARNRI